MTDLFASESKQDILTTLNKYVLDEAWVKRINSHLLNSVDSYQPNEEEKSHSLFESFQTYSNLIKERLLDFITDYPEFGTTEKELIARLTELKDDKHLQLLLKLLNWDTFILKIETLSKQKKLGEEALDLLGL